MLIKAAKSSWTKLSVLSKIHNILTLPRRIEVNQMERHYWSILLIKISSWKNTCWLWVFLVIFVQSQKVKKKFPGNKGTKNWQWLDRRDSHQGYERFLGTWRKQSVKSRRSRHILLNFWKIWISITCQFCLQNGWYLWWRRRNII